MYCSNLSFWSYLGCVLFAEEDRTNEKFMSILEKQVRDKSFKNNYIPYKPT